MVECDLDGRASVWKLQKVALGDIDCALKLIDEKTLDAMMGNVMWRSPEGQIGKGIGKPSEVFSFGLLCFFVITGVEWLHPNFDDLETDPEPVILYKLLTAFGPLPKALVSHINDEQGGALMEGLWEAIEDEGLYEPFKDWPQKRFPNLDHEAKGLILRMTNLDPAKRATMSQVMEDPYWDAVRDLRVVGAKGSTKDY
ncbi:hypothetical protein D6C93_02388 [Aureobasidium pullulans]|nr:hypothetical protein D6C93_02388 [Aureobasidium pullulans]